MTDKELTIWEHLDSVIRVLTCKEMGAWLYRRDKRVLATELENIKAEFEKEIEIKKKQNYSMDFLEGVYDCLMLIEDRLDELKGE